MVDAPRGDAPAAANLRLVVRRSILAPPARVFAFWTQPELVREWWGPTGATCEEAHIDLRVGGQYRLANRLPDGQLVWIVGAFETVSPPGLLAYTWAIPGRTRQAERVTVRFEATPAGTDVVVLHERIADRETLDGHSRGWEGCLDGLARVIEG